MRKIIYLLALVLFSGTVFVSCDKDDDTEPQEKKFVPIKITEYDEGIFDGETLFEYDDNSLLIKRDFGDGYYNTYEYDAEEKLTKFKVYEENIMYSYDTYEYNSSNQIIKIQSYNDESEAESYYTHEYDTEGNVIKKTEYSINGTLVLYFTFSYDENGNMINKKYYWADDPSGVDTDQYEEWAYTYDDKNNIYKSLEIPFLWQSIVNNRLKSIYIEHYGDNYTDTYTCTYIYNEDNYPIEYTEETEKYIIEYKEI